MSNVFPIRPTAISKIVMVVNFHEYLNYTYGYHLPYNSDTLEYRDLLVEAMGPLAQPVNRYNLIKWMTQGMGSSLLWSAMGKQSIDERYELEVFRKNMEALESQGGLIECPDAVVSFMHTCQKLPNTPDGLVEFFAPVIDKYRGIAEQLGVEAMAEAMNKQYGFFEFIYLKTVYDPPIPLDPDRETPNEFRLFDFILDVVMGRRIERCGYWWWAMADWSDETPETEPPVRKKWAERNPLCPS